MAEIERELEAETGPSMHEKVDEIRDRVSEIPALRAAMEVIADRLAIIEDEMSKPAGPSPLQEVLEKLVAVVAAQNEQLKKLTAMSDLPAVHAEWREWFDGLKEQFGGLVDDVADPGSAVAWDWVTENHPAPDESLSN